MALRRFFVESSQIQGDLVSIHGDLFHHIRDVCRFSIGDRFEILTGDGNANLVEIQAIDKKSMRTRVLSQRKLPEPQRPLITLALSIPKLPKVDWIVEKSVELGVYAIRPFVSDFSFLRKPQEITANRLERWEKLVTAATQQSGRGDLMKVHSPLTLESLLMEFNRNPGIAGLFPFEGDAQMGLKQAITKIKQDGQGEVWVFVGSEGGFSQREVELFTGYGLNPVSMGEQILRVETACLALASILKYECGALG